jgi:DNA-binding NarL/FixJ family response regulator
MTMSWSAKLCAPAPEDSCKKAKRPIISFMLALRRPYFTGRVSQAMLANFLRNLPPTPILTSREREVVQLIAEGSSNKQIAATLGLSTKTIETHRSAAMRKIGVKNLADLVRYAVRNRIVEP